MLRPTQRIWISFLLATAHLVVPFDNHGPAAEEQKLQGRAECGWAGVRVGPMTTPFADSLGLVASYGAIFDRPEPGSPAARAKIEAGDVLTAIVGVPLEKWSDFEGIIANWAPGSTVYLNTWRDGQLMPRDVTLGSSRCPNQPSGSSSTISRLSAPSTSAPKSATAFNTNQLGQRGPVLLSGIVQLIGRSIQLQGEVNVALTALGKTVDEVTCIGEQFPGQWNNLAGRTAAPYACDFTDKRLLIDATVTVTGSNRKVYGSITQAAIEDADAVAQHNPIWVWTAKK